MGLPGRGEAREWSVSGLFLCPRGEPHMDACVVYVPVGTHVLYRWMHVCYVCWIHMGEHTCVPLDDCAYLYVNT